LDGLGLSGIASSALDVEEDWDDEARRYFIGIVGKYGPQVQKLLKVAAWPGTACKDEGNSKYSYENNFG